MKEPIVDTTATAELLVSANDLASALPGEPQDAFPAVLATARMLALMEIASARILQPCLGPGEMSVGVNADLTHSAPTPAGVKVTATARYLGRNGKLFRFEVAAVDPGGEIGRARHERAIVSVERLQQGALRRINPAPPAGPEPPPPT